ncbi:alpha/beta fold hydrolase [Sphaerochaeta globosa]|uniref:Alpha/beta hydrolase fold protein n=1 Tax=Sphaerochaeta globosa (strain ATCC BAA-1886 / DSM 22777 / Buddy) TaxID=158189 RepID=F0RUT2_SPHGB|nr:alpha/beta hydrolase [Sphaerochaeta globosa]ADY12510.1 alpha/beta hydrolase fold protein [Sphaerochaeta globosa str. Buddy]
MKNSGYFRGGLPYTQIGNGPKPLVVFDGLTFEHKPQSPAMVKIYSFLEKDYTIYSVLRKPQLPEDYTLDDMAQDYAQMLKEEFSTPVDIIGISTGGSIALHFAALYPDLVRHLILHSSAHTLNDKAKQLQLDIAHFAQKGQWRKAWSLLVATGFPQSGFAFQLSKPLVAVIAFLLSVHHPKDANDLLVTVQAEDKHAFLDRLGEISCSTLVAGGEDDYFYSSQLFKETAQGIPNARLCLYPDMGHPAGGKRFKEDVLNFLHAD